MRKGLKDTMVFGLFKDRPDTVPLLFPSDTSSALSAEVTVIHTGAVCIHVATPSINLPFKNLIGLY